jgi:hypothetical protein
VSKIALIRLDNNEVVRVFDGVPGSVQLPGVGSVSPVAVGWRGGGELTYERSAEGKERAVEGPPRFALVAVLDAEPAPQGKRVASISHHIASGMVIETVTLEDAPAPKPAPTPIEKLQAVTGLTVDEIKAALAVK